MTIVSWKCIFSIPVIFSIAKNSVYCVPIGESPTLDNTSQGSWSGLSDIVKLDHFDPSWQDDIQSANKEGKDADVSQNTERGKKKSTRKRFRSSVEDKLKRKVHLENMKKSRKSDPVAEQAHKKKRNEWNRKWRTNMLSKLTESEKAALLLREKQARQRYNKSVKNKYGGYSNPKMQRLNGIKTLQKEGKATENELKFLQDYREKTKLTRRKERAALKGVVRKG